MVSYEPGYSLSVNHFMLVLKAIINKGLVIIIDSFNDFLLIYKKVIFAGDNSGNIIYFFTKLINLIPKLQTPSFADLSSVVLT